jgi:hypothetical protein
MKRIAAYGDPHGCIDELKELHRIVSRAYPDADHWHLGDLVDRGPDSGGCVDYVMREFDGGVRGNHEDTILNAWFARQNRIARGEKIGPHPNPDKERTLSQLDKEKVEYLKKLPHLHVFDDLGLILVHGGLIPNRSLYAQPPKVCIRAQMIKPDDPTASGRWWGGDSSNQPRAKKTEEQSRKEGYVRWYEVYDQEYDCIYGHSVMGLDPYIHQREGYGKTIGIDTGSCFGGFLTALVYPDMKVFKVPCKEYVEGKNVRTFKGMTVP